MIGNILAAVAGSATSAILGGGGRSSQRLPQFDRRPAPFRRRVENVMEPGTKGMETLPEESAQVGTLQALINKHKAIMASLDVDKQE
jgi:hypothetical protein